MQRSLGVLLMAVIGIMPMKSLGASFDCNKAATRSEKMICSNVELSKADESLGKVYKSALASTQDKAVLKQQQKEWIKMRDAMTDAATMLSAYQDRTALLSSRGSTVTPSTGALQPFPHINKYVGSNPDAVLKDKTIQSALKKLLGKRFKDLDLYMSVSNGVAFNSAGALEMEGCMPHNCMGNAAKIYIQKTGEIYAGILDDSKVIFFTNDSHYKKQPIQPILDFAKEKEVAIVIAK